jgi:glycyl-tRNA synthetase beta chain
MPEFFLELFSEEIPARMQARAAEDLKRLVTALLAQLEPSDVRTFYGPRRIAMAAQVPYEATVSSVMTRGPRIGAPESALDGFVRKTGASRDKLSQWEGYWVLTEKQPPVKSINVIRIVLPSILRRLPWPKSMRWGGTSQFTWIRPLRRITCLLDGEIVPFNLRDGDDDGHGLAASNLTEGHRFLSPGAFPAASCAEWQQALRERHVIADATERRRLITDELHKLAGKQQLRVVDDPDLLDEVCGLVEWPVPLLGRIDPAYMDLPAEVMQVSMRVNQRYFALRDDEGRAVPYFAFVANITAPDGGRTIVAGNERVLRARFADARHFWDLDRTRKLESRVAALDGITFHARLGSQGERVRRLIHLAAIIAPHVGADVTSAQRAALLTKADLTTGMVGEFPELQGVMGRYYALHDGEDASVADAIRDHYAPRGPADAVPRDPVGIAVALADKLDLLAGFFAIGEKPTGSGDPYALRRAALGIIRIIRERGLRLKLRRLITAAAADEAMPADVEEIMEFLAERLRVQLRAEGARHDVLAAVLGTGIDDDLARLLARTDAVTEMLGTDDGSNLLVGYRRAANILRIEERKDGPHDRPVDARLMEATQERNLLAALERVEPVVVTALSNENFTAAVAALATLRPPLDAFFDKVTVNDARPELRRNRLALLASVRGAMNRVADFSKIEG